MKVINHVEDTTIHINKLSYSHIIVGKIGESFCILVKDDFYSDEGYRWRVLDSNFTKGNRVCREFNSIHAAVLYADEVQAFDNLPDFGAYLIEKG